MTLRCHFFFNLFVFVFLYCRFLLVTSFLFLFLIIHQFYTHQCIHVNPNRPIQHIIRCHFLWCGLLCYFQLRKRVPRVVGDPALSWDKGYTLGIRVNKKWAWQAEKDRGSCMSQSHHWAREENRSHLKMWSWYSLIFVVWIYITVLI